MTLNNRSRLKKINTIFQSSIVTKVVSVLYVLINVPMVYNSLTAEQFAIWTILTGLPVASQFADLGIGNGLINTVSESYAENNPEAIRKAVTNTSILLFLLSTLILLVYLFFYHFIHWPKFFNLHSAGTEYELKLSFSIMILLFVINLPFSTVQRVQIAMQRGHITNFWTIVGLLLSLIGNTICSVLESGLPMFVFVTLAGPVVSVILSWCYEFYILHPNLSPRALDYDLRSWSTILGQGRLWTAFQLSAFIGGGLDTIIIAHYFSPTIVIQYSMMSRLYSGLLISPLYAAPTWPAFTDAIKNKDIGEGTRIFERNILIGSILGIIGGLILWFYGPMIIELWLTKKLILDANLVLGFSIWYFVSSIYSCVSSPMSGRETLASLVTLSAIAALISSLLKSSLLPNAGPGFVAVANSIGYGLMSLIVYLKMRSYLKYKLNLI